MSTNKQIKPAVNKTVTLDKDLMEFAQREADKDLVLAGNFSALIRKWIIEKREKIANETAGQK